MTSASRSERPTTSTKPIDRERLLRVWRRTGRARESAPILVVDDEDGTREMLRRLLEREGWEVEEAPNGRVGLDLIAARRPALILLDLMMPEVDGFEVVDHASGSSGVARHPDRRADGARSLARGPAAPERAGRARHLEGRVPPRRPARRGATVHVRRQYAGQVSDRTPSPVARYHRVRSIAAPTLCRVAVPVYPT